MAEEGNARSFWDVGEPRKTLRRIEDGHRSCNDLMCMIHERADVELRYAKSLRQWAAKWDDLLAKGPEYGTVLTAWRTVLQEASAVAKIHEDCRMRLTGDEGPYYNIYKWMSDYFHTSAAGGLRETQEAREDFASAQRDYAKLLAKVNRAKKAYYAASIAAYRSRQYADDEASSPAVSPEAKWKLRERADQLVLERERLKQVYLRRVMACNSTTKERYVEKMMSVFSRWQEFEQKRLEHLQLQLQLFVQNLSTHSGTGMGQVYRRVLEQLRRAEPATDIEEWAQRYGTGCHATWPKYEEIDPRTHPLDGGLSTEVIQQRDLMALTATDKMVDEFTTDDDSDLDVKHQHLAHSGRGHTKLYTYRPYRTYQHELQFFTVKHPSWQDQQWRHPQQCPLEGSFSQNEDLSDRWLKEQLGGQGRMREWDSSGQWRHKGGAGQMDYHTYQSYHLASHPRHADLNHLHRGQKSNIQEHHHKKESSPRIENDTKWSSSRHQAHNHRVSDGFLNRIVSTSQSQDSYTHDDDKTITTQGGFDADYGYHGNAKSDASSSAGHTGSSQEGEMFYSQQVKDQMNEAHQRKSSIQTGGQAASGQTPSQQVQLAQPSLTQAATQAEVQPVERKRGSKGPVELGQALVQTLQQKLKQKQGQATPTATPSSMAQHRSETDEKATLLEQARKALQPQQGERIVRALYDFKPSTKDELSLKQSEYIIQIGKNLTNGWAYGRKVGAKGHFPASYVQ